MLAGADSGNNSYRVRTPRCSQATHRQLRDEASKQVTEAAEEIMLANVEKAKAGSLTHTRWLFSLMEALHDEEHWPEGTDRKSLAEILIRQLKTKQ